MEYVSEYGEHLDIPPELLQDNINVTGEYEVEYDFTPLIENEYSMLIEGDNNE